MEPHVVICQCVPAIVSLQMELDKGNTEEEISDYDIACIICNGLMHDICINDDMVRLSKLFYRSYTYLFLF